VTVIVPARDAEATIGRALDGLAAQWVEGGFEVIVVDDRSGDATAASAREHPLAPRVLEGAADGPAAARNAGARAAEAPLLAFMDADCTPAPGWLAAGVEALAAADLVQGAVEAPPGETVGPYDRGISVSGPSALFETANLLVRREWFERLGGFESWMRPRRGIEMAEDVWFGWRARRAGARVAFCNEVLVYHRVYPRGPAGYVAELARLRFFPAMAVRIPELRDAFFYRRFFFSPRSAAFDLAVAGAVLAAARRRPALAALAAAPYVRQLARDSRYWGRRRAPALAAVRAAGDAVSLGALAIGSVRARTVLL
jgi:glycosyltransferase involved in cell wall biosynthesis